MTDISPAGCDAASRTRLHDRRNDINISKTGYIPHCNAMCRAFYKLHNQSVITLTVMLQIWKIQRIVTGRPTCFEVSLFCALQRRIRRQLQIIWLANVLMTLEFIFSSLDKRHINHNVSWPLLHAPFQHQDPYNISSVGFNITVALGFR